MSGEQQEHGQQSSPIDDLERAFREGDFHQALKLLHVLAAIYPDGQEIPVLTLRCYLGLGRPLRALMAAQKFKGDHFNNPGVLELMRVVYQELLLEDRAMQVARHLVQTAEVSEETYDYFVHSLVQGEHAVEASDVIGAGLTKYPHSEGLKYSKGILHLKLGQMSEASAISEELKSQGSALGSDLSSLIDRGLSEPDGNVPGEADDKVREHMKKATEFLAKGDPEAASRAVIEAIRLDDTFALAYTRLGYIYDHCGLHDESMDLHRKAIEKDPALIEAYRNLAYSSYRRGDFKQALDTYAKALEADPNNVELHNSMGVVYDNLGNHAEAIAHFQQALKLDPGSEASWRNLGFAYQAEGKLDDAIAVYERAIGIDPRSRARINLATLFRTIHRYGDGKEILGTIIADNPDSLTAWLELALCHKGLNEDEQFVEAFEKAKGLAPKTPAEAFTKAQLMELLEERTAYDCWQAYAAMARNAPQEARRTAYARDRIGALGNKLGLTPPTAYLIGEEQRTEEASSPESE